jgi:hypothetical protein
MRGAVLPAPGCGAGVVLIAAGATAVAQLGRHLSAKELRQRHGEALEHVLAGNRRPFA